MIQHAFEPKASELPAEVAVELQKVLRVLSQDNAQRILLYGSFARGDYADHSDFDLCVDGISPRDFFLAYTECLMATDHRLSLVELQDARGYFRERILKEGKVVYEAPGISARASVRP